MPVDFIKKNIARLFSTKKNHQALTEMPLHWKAKKNWRGGVKLNSKKQLTNSIKIAELKSGYSILHIPLSVNQSIDSVRVYPGQKVYKGQVLAGKTDNEVWVHAPTSGKINEIIEGYTCSSDQPQILISLQADGQDAKDPFQAPSPAPNKDDLATFLMKMGIVGLGGAGFPTGRKISATPEVKYLIINGIECEPYITSDDRLMQERSDEIIEHIELLAKILEAEYIRVGIECNKPKALKKMRQSSIKSALKIEIVEVPTFYPAGSQQALIKSLTNIQLNAGEHPNQYGIVLINVATAYAAGRAIKYNEPLTSRIITLTGDVSKPRNLAVPIGTPVRQLIQKCKPRNSNYAIWVGGPMMGRILSNKDSVIAKTNSCLIIQTDNIDTTEATECIRCSRCIDACPAHLQPVQLYTACIEENKTLQSTLKLSACIECGACSSVCPSHIPLRDTFRITKRK